MPGHWSLGYTSIKYSRLTTSLERKGGQAACFSHACGVGTSYDVNKDLTTRALSLSLSLSLSLGIFIPFMVYLLISYYGNIIVKVFMNFALWLKVRKSPP